MLWVRVMKPIEKKPCSNVATMLVDVHYRLVEFSREELLKVSCCLQSNVFFLVLMRIYHFNFLSNVVVRICWFSSPKWDLLQSENYRRQQVLMVGDVLWTMSLLFFQYVLLMTSLPLFLQRSWTSFTLKCLNLLKVEQCLQMLCCGHLLKTVQIERTLSFCFRYCRTFEDLLVIFRLSNKFISNSFCSFFSSFQSYFSTIICFVI